MVEHVDHSRCFAWINALRSVPGKSRHRAQYADPAARRTGQGGFAGKAPLQRTSAARRICSDRARPRFSAGHCCHASLGQQVFRARRGERAARACEDWRAGGSSAGRSQDRTSAGGPGICHRAWTGRGGSNPAQTGIERVGSRHGRRPFVAVRPASYSQIPGAPVSVPASAALDVDVRRAALNPRTRLLLEGRIVPTLLRMAWPNILVMGAQAATGLIETWFVSRLGIDALAGMALVFPGFMMMQMLSAGAVGGGISSAIARALGSARRDDANALVMHAIAVNVALGLLFSGLFIAFGPQLYRAMGGEAASLQAALDYSNVVFAGAVLVWLLNALASALRGTGNML